MNDAVTPALEPGDRVPNFYLECDTGEFVSLYDQAMGGALVVFFVGRLESDAGARCLREAAGQLADGAGDTVHPVVVTREPSAVAARAREESGFPGRILCDEGDEAAGAFRTGWPAVAESVQGFVLDANQRLLTALPVHSPHPAADARQVLDALPAVEARTVSHPAPALLVPRVFEPAFCQHLIDAFHHQGHEEGGVYSMKEGVLLHQVDATIKKRQDHSVRDRAIGDAIAARLMRRVLPEIQKAFHYRVTAAEEYKVVRYRGEESGFFGAHRDDMSPQTAHRRFAITLNLNEGYEGGYLCFPEYGPHRYRPGPGDAIVFSCSLLHRVAPVTGGDRFVLLAFLYGEDGKQQKRQIEEMMAKAGQQVQR